MYIIIIDKIECIFLLYEQRQNICLSKLCVMNTRPQSGGAFSAPTVHIIYLMQMNGAIFCRPCLSDIVTLNSDGPPTYPPTIQNGVR